MTTDEQSPPDVLRLEIMSGARAGVSERFGESPVRIGRHPGSDLQLHPREDSTVSKEHALLDRDVGGWFVRDLDSRNGTLVNGDRLRTDRYLEDGDEIQLGPRGPRLRVGLAPAGAVAGTDGPEEEGRQADDRRGVPTWAWVSALLATAAGVGLVAFGVLSDGTDGGTPDGGAPERGPGPAALEQDTSRRVADAERTRPGTARIDTSAAADPAADTGRQRALEARMDSLTRALRESRERVAALEERLAERQADPGPPASEQQEERAGEGAGGKEADQSREDLERELQSARAALRRQQLAADVNVDAIESRNWRALAQLYVEWPDGRVVTASAFSIRPSGVLVTAGHVVQARDGTRPERVAVQFARSRQVWPGEVLAASRSPDVALVRARRIAGQVPTVQGFNRRPDTLASGVPMVIMGFPLGGDVAPPGTDESAAPPRPLVTLGLLSGRSGRLMEFQGYGERGASGSPIFDATGRVVAVLLGGREDGGRRHVLGIPVTAALELPDEPSDGGGEDESGAGG